MDADDISVPERFEKQLTVFENDKKLSVVGGNISEFIDNTENTVGSRIVPKKDAEIKEYIKKRCPMNQVTVMFKKTDVNNVGGYIAVSYTHLDVYKRQIQDPAVCRAKRAIQARRVFRV